MSDGKLGVAHVLIEPRLFQRPMSERDMQAVEELIEVFQNRMQGESLVCAAQALGVLTADYCQQITDRGGEAVYAMQDIAGRGERWIHAGRAAEDVVKKVRKRIDGSRRRNAGKVR